jgi:peptide/nickel transport system substrate-binding protein
VDPRAREHLDAYRFSAGELENSLIDEFAAGEIDRATFIRNATMLGLAASAIGSGVALFGGGAPAFAASAAPLTRSAGKRLRLACVIPPTGAIEPILSVETGQVVTCGVMGEYLTRSTEKLTLAQELAVSWKPNQDASVWTFKLRPNVKFANGEPFGADDVVATYDRLTDPDSGSQALSAYKGVLSKGGTKKIDDLTVQFTLDGPNASFPFATSNTTYNAILLPRDYKMGTFTTQPSPTTAGFMMTSYNPGVGATYDRNPGWWGGTTPMDGVDLTYYADDAAANAALLGGQTDLISQTSVATGRPLLNNPSVQLFRTRGAAHREIALAVDMNPDLRDYRVRQAIAYTLDRPAIVKKLWSGFADVGNESPFAPVYPSTVKMTQRAKNIPKAKQLMAQAGKSKGFKVKLTTWQQQELPNLAAIVKESVKQIGIDMSLEVQTGKKYFGGKYEGGKFGLGTTPWLNTECNITDWGHRAVPNVFLTASLMTGGIWNASHWKNKKFDKAAKSFIKAIALSDQRKYAAEIEKLMLHDTPVIYPYFYYFLGAGVKSIRGYSVDPVGGITVSRLSL